MRFISCADYTAMSRQAANLISAQVIVKPNCVLGLATGSTPIGTYKQLIEWYNKGDLSFANVRSVNLDEYKGLSGDHDQSYRYFMQNNLFNHVDIDVANTSVPNGKAEDADAECAAYDAHIRELGGIDLQLLGMGHNGHIGFNEPADEFVGPTHVVELAQSTIDANKRFFASEADVPRQALTMGMAAILQARSVVVVVSGEDKAEIVHKAFFGPITPRVPASLLQLHPNVTVVGDEAAFSVLRKEGCL
ncbi:glucosamine-6-phosphate deaminase [Pseudoflavonifractor capillosus]|uniref:Glucosamine-6-phosphate deaminase n=1 Tax=Candidatus Enterenecus faecium TaxID=2840780 RepID=A0A9D0YT25_9FIRM|nr:MULTISPECIES: glucosamine-6-phosphate deaminase [Pseudoflavonifractor]HIQ61452.1 glucosamine-6-phosphate deaminase [Candidatus Enterenecus faecium]MBM6694098.1 glucosamine-6-phosphate deaminase [Pseudoflavonifractor capillosus]NJE73876.1 glucosamine-6-phosphate deaminase [Pseudoflavonifractor sp. SW1122]OUN92643.1 glucosamine-6-phosphate deaminase [Pseudoflavonifractor sp. An44]OUP65736.1 glucosamine-6-phosphate deaminase [Pseudoflavonifractor sp. An176]